MLCGCVSFTERLEDKPCCSSHSPSGGCSMSPFLSQVPIGWISNESISLQKSLVLSLPSRRKRRRIPIMPITVAMHTELELRGSRASSFMPALKSLEGGTLDCRETHSNFYSNFHTLRSYSRKHNAHVFYTNMTTNFRAHC